MADHAHAHAHDARESSRARLLVVAVSGALVALVEVVGGLYANSLVLLADAAHYATDVAAVLLAFLAVHLALRPATARKTFGLRRAEVLAAFVNAAALWGLSAYFLYEAYARLRRPEPVSGGVIMVVGAFTLVANVGLALVLARTSRRNVSVRAAYLHILSDVMGSAAALVAGLLVRYLGWQSADAVLTLFVTVLILIFTWRLTKETLNILLEGAPQHLDVTEVERAIREVAPVKEIHELHVWTLTPGSEMLTVHVVLDAPPQGDAVTHDIHAALRSRFHIDHVTVQVESPECPCEMARCAPEPPAARHRAS